MNRDEIQRWARMYRDFLMVEREGTIDEVFAAADDWIGESSFFPTVANLAPLVEEQVLRRREQAMIAAAQREAVALPELESGDVDWSQVRTADLPPGYDHAEDPHWQRGIALATDAIEGKADASPMGVFVKWIHDRMQDNAAVGFQGASKEHETVCPACHGSRWVRLGGWDAPKQIPGTPGSRYVMCATCCPHGRYSEQAEREAARKAAR